METKSQTLRPPDEVFGAGIGATLAGRAWLVSAETRGVPRGEEAWAADRGVPLGGVATAGAGALGRAELPTGGVPEGGVLVRDS